jgi:putative pyruvate formate lyase activating enzyme
MLVKKDIEIPFVYNSNGYDALPSLKLMDGLIDVYMPDLKYADDANGQRYSNVPDYFSVASKALLEMYGQVGDPVIQHGVMRKGLLIRHLVMPGLTGDSMAVLDWIKANIPSALVNLMDQYRPAYRAGEFAEINRRLTASEYRQLAVYFSELGLRDC